MSGLIFSWHRIRSYFFFHEFILIVSDHSNIRRRKRNVRFEDTVSMETRAELQGFRELLQKEKQLAQIKTKVRIHVHFLESLPKILR